MTLNSFDPFEERMCQAGMSPAAIAFFRHNYETLVAGETGLISEAELEPVGRVPRYEECAGGKADAALLSETVVVKLNGGLGTSMGLEKAKSILEVKGGLTFLDFLALQVLHLRATQRTQLRFLVLNSFATSKDTLAFLSRYPQLGPPEDLEIRQSQVPKVDAVTLGPARWPANRALEWCPPGHGDLYPSLAGSGWLDRLLDAGVKYMFVSNSDNLGASLDPAILSYFAQSGAPFLMEVAQRTVSDRKGGHLGRRAGKYLLRESAQCPKAEMDSFQDIAKHQFFNTNNLWLRLDALQQMVRANQGFIPLPLIRNAKTVDPRDRTSPAVFQLETAMGAAIEAFSGSQALLVPRTRFSPVKTTSDLLTLRSDAYEVTEDKRLVLAGRAAPPSLDLDPDHYQLVDQLDASLSRGVPSLRECSRLSLRGPVSFRSDNRFVGSVTILNPATERREVPAGQYRDCEVQL